MLSHYGLSKLWAGPAVPMMVRLSCSGVYDDERYAPMFRDRAGRSSRLRLSWEWVQPGDRGG